MGGETMKVGKVINNNILSSHDEKGGEVIVMGCGIGFKVKPGELINEDKIEKIFQVKNHSEAEQLISLFADMPIEHIKVSNEIIQYAKGYIAQKINRTIYLTLTDHISFAIQRNSEGINLHNALSWEITKFYKQEYKVGEKALEIIKKQLGIELPQDEAASIAMHFVNAQLNGEMPETVNITKIIQNVFNIIKYNFQLEIYEESIHYVRFMTHLKFFAQRVVTNNLLETTDEALQDMVRQKYKKAYLCAQKIGEYIEKVFQQVIGEEEKIFLAVHIQRITMKSDAMI